MLDVVLIQESANEREVSVAATEGLVKIDLYHPPLDIEVGIKTSYLENVVLEPSNISPDKDWNFKRCDWEQVYYWLSIVSWGDVLAATDVHNAIQKFYSILYNIFNLSMPKKRRTASTTRSYPVWFTREIINDIKVKLKLHKTWKRTQCDKAYQEFSRVRADLKIRAARAYVDYTKRIECNIKTNPREFWRHISALRTKGGFESIVSYGGEHFSGSGAAEAFAIFFGSVFLSRVPQLDAERALSSDSTKNSNNIDINTFTQADVLFGLKKLKPSNSVGPDSVPSTLLKRAKFQLCTPLRHIFNLALESGIYPEPWKTSRVTPIPKSTNKSLVEEYRPIAIMSAPAKVFESILHKYIYVQVNKYLCSEQHGFRSKRSVNTNLLTLVHYISSQLDRGTQVDVLYFDFRKAFDRVDNDILLKKLVGIGFTPKMVHLLADYLRDRQQYVRLGLYESQSYHTRSGVSQGSILGPLLFLIMVNDLPTAVDAAKCLLYADDLKLFSNIRSKSDCEALQRDINAVFEWSIVNNMEFNVTKCCVMTFGRMQLPIIFDYQLNNISITRRNDVRDLGVTFDSKLTFNPHITALAKESYRRLGFVLRNARDFSDISVIKLLFSALVRSKLETAACIWNPHESSYALSLEKVQKAFLRYLYKRAHGYYPYMYPTQFLLGSLGYNSLEVRRAYDQIVTCLKILRDIVDSPDLNAVICRLFCPNKYVRGRKHHLLAVPTSHTVSHSKSPVLRSINAINALLDASAETDLFADEWRLILSVCLDFCERNV